MDVSRLLKLLEFADRPAALHLDLANGKKFRKKYSCLNALIKDAHNRSYDNAVIDDVLLQHSLLDKMEFIMVYGHEE